MVAGRGSPTTALSAAEVRQILSEGIPESLVAGKKVLVLTPDATRSCPLPMLVKALGEAIGPQVRQLDFMVALGSHRPLSDAEILALYGLSGERPRELSASRFLSHRWDLRETLVRLGTIPEQEIEQLTGGLFREAVNVDINRLIHDYDLLLILGPVFPHEVVGFSGGNKYLFPGISGGEFLHFTHWLGAVITCMKTIGFKHTAVRKLVDRAARLVPVPRHCVSLVVGSGDRLAGLFAGPPEEAWSMAADLSAQMHIVYKDQPYHTVLGRAPEMYGELWVAGKVMYKLEPVVAGGGRLIIYGSHIREVSYTWGNHLNRVGYHVRDYFLKQWDRFRDVPWAVLAHSTHVKGQGSFAGGVERPRIEVILATAIPERRCRELNLGYLNPDSIRIEDYRHREEQGVLFVDKAGEILHRLVTDHEEDR